LEHNPAGFNVVATPRTEEDEMLAIDCPCGHHFEAENEDELFAKCREHVDHDHPEMERTDEQLRARVNADAYEVETAS